MSIYIGNKPLKNVYLGNTLLKAVYKGSELLWSSYYTLTINITPNTGVNSVAVYVNSEYFQEVTETSSVKIPAGSKVELSIDYDSDDYECSNNEWESFEADETIIIKGIYFYRTLTVNIVPNTGIENVCVEITPPKDRGEYYVVVCEDERSIVEIPTGSQVLLSVVDDYSCDGDTHWTEFNSNQEVTVSGLATYVTLTIDLQRVNNGASPDYSVNYISVTDEMGDTVFLSENVTPASGTMAEDSEYEITIPKGTTVRVSWDASFGWKYKVDSSGDRASGHESDDYIFTANANDKFTLCDIIHYTKIECQTDEIVEYIALTTEEGEEYILYNEYDHDSSDLEDVYSTILKTCCKPTSSKVSIRDGSGRTYDYEDSFWKDPAYTDDMHWILGCYHNP